MRLAISILTAAILAGACVSSDLTLKAVAPIPFYIEGHVDRGRGVVIAVQRTLAPNESFDIDSLNALTVTDAFVALCDVGGDNCAEVPLAPDGSYTLAELPSWITDSASLMIEIGGETYESKGFIPNPNVITYLPRETRFVPQDANGDQVYGDTYAHDFAFTVSDPSLIGILAHVTRDDDSAGPLFVRGSPSPCGVLTYFSAADQVLFPTCPLEQTVDLRLYTFSEEGSSGVSFDLVVSSDVGYFDYLAAVGQDGYDSAFGALYDVLLQGSNVQGLGGYVLFSASTQVDVVF